MAMKLGENTGIQRPLDKLVRPKQPLRKGTHPNRLVGQLQSLERLGGESGDVSEALTPTAVRGQGCRRSRGLALGLRTTLLLLAASTYPSKAVTHAK
jgi:hypothetical protein